MIPSFIQRKIGDAKRIIEGGMNIAKKPYVSCSFGKDSTVVLWLALQIDPNIPVVWFDGGKFDEYPDTYAYKTFLQAEWKLNLTTVYPSMSFIDQMKTFGSDDKTHYDHFFTQAFLDESARENYDGSMLGLRAQESNNRRITFRVRGQLYFHKGQNIWRICPIMNWTTVELWNVIDVAQIPIHPIYTKNVFQKREDIRLGCMANALKHQRGDIVFIKYYYPELWNELVGMFTEFGKMS